MRRSSLVVLGAALLAAPVARPVHAQDAPVVVVTEARLDPFPLTVEAIGTTRANESIELRPRVTEAVRAIRFQEGQRVTAGQVLVELDDAEALAAVAAAKAALVESTGQHRRGQELYSNELASASQLELLEARRDADQAALDAAEARLADTVIRAPFAGRVGLRRVSPGSLVSPSVVITTLDDTETVKLDFDVPETALSLLREDLPVRARSAAYPDSVFAGRVQSVDTRVDPVSRTITVRARIPNAEGLLRPGMFLTVRLLRDDVNALVIPEEAIVPERSEQFVLVVADDGTVEKRAVTLGRRRPGEVEVLRSLAAGERVVVEGTQKARTGGKVQARLRAEAAP
ncbi:MAG: efflux RND transporter periplasmic adaptor subunit [bacterium]